MILHQVTPASIPVDVRLRPPGSKSITIRALAVAALASGTSVLHDPLHAEDTEAMSRAVQGFGAALDQQGEPWRVTGVGGRVTAPPEPIDAGESGLTARIAIAIAALAPGTTVIRGRGRLPERPLGGLVQALASCGVEMRTNKGGLPAEVAGRGHIAGGEVTVDCTESSQFATAIMLIAPLFDDSVRLLLTGLTGSSGYLEVSRQVMVSFGAQVEPIEGGFEIRPSGYRGASFTVEPDASAAVYPLVAAAITAGRAEIEGLHIDSSQPDLRLADALEEMGCQVTAGEEAMVLTGPERLNPIDTNMAEAPDAALALAVACLFANGESRIGGLASLRHKESDRLRSLVETFTELGARARVEGDTLVVTPGRLRSAVIDSHGDHRVAMSLALVGLRVPGVAIARPEVVAKTWPGYWSVLERMVSGG